MTRAGSGLVGECREEILKAGDDDCVCGGTWCHRVRKDDLDENWTPIVSIDVKDSLVGIVVRQGSAEAVRLCVRKRVSRGGTQV